MQEMIIEIMNQAGYIGVCLLIALENIFPPIPSEIILSFGGFMTTYTNMNVAGVVVFATMGSVLGAIVLYAIGCLLTPERLEGLFNRKLFRVLGFKKGDITKTVKWFEKRGKKAILFGRCVPIIRSLISIPAGMAKINFFLFLLYTAIGSTVWNILLVSLGAFMGNSWEKVFYYFDMYSSITVFVLGGICMVMCLIFVKKRVLQRES
ncbi:Alkaline phosphatase-like protein [Clostridiaceae bacterium BL-3]|nr:Alkaline phosphatase-like protein [Clostridiaceae bacterium BL-3]